MGHFVELNTSYLSGTTTTTFATLKASEENDCKLYLIKLTQYPTVSLATD